MCPQIHFPVTMLVPCGGGTIKNLGVVRLEGGAFIYHSIQPVWIGQSTTVGLSNRRQHSGLQVTDRPSCQKPYLPRETITWSLMTVDTRTAPGGSCALEPGVLVCYSEEEPPSDETEGGLLGENSPIPTTTTTTTELNITARFQETDSNSPLLLVFDSNR